MHEEKNEEKYGANIFLWNDLVIAFGQKGSSKKSFSLQFSHTTVHTEMNEAAGICTKENICNAFT